MTYSDGDVYKGDWVDDKRTGKGKMTYSDGAVYEGDFVDGIFQGMTPEIAKPKVTAPKSSLIEMVYVPGGSFQILVQSPKDRLDME